MLCRFSKIDLIFEHKNFCDLKPELYLDVVEDTYSGKFNVPTAVGREINNSIEKLRVSVFV